MNTALKESADDMIPDLQVVGVRYAMAFVLISVMGGRVFFADTLWGAVEMSMGMRF